MQEMTRLDCADWLLDHDRFVILTHRKPDGDTVGSAAGLCRGLRSMGKTAHVLENPDITPLFAPLLEGLTKERPEEGDLLVAVDVAADNMLPRAYDDLKFSIDLRIDHHGSGREYTPREHVDPESASCAEIIWELLLDMEIEPDKETAEAIYVGVATDTGCFRFANTTAHTFDVAGDCAAAGADVYSWNQRIFDTRSMAKLRLQAWITEHVQLLSGGSIALCAIPVAVEEELGVSEDDWNDISSFLRSIEGVKMSALLRQSSESHVKASLRAVPGYDVSVICGQFGGGGHAGAAGCSVKMTLQEAAAVIGNAMVAY